jgi:hypothetical protein
VGEVLGSRGNTKAKKLLKGGTLFARITAVPVEEMGMLHFSLRGVKLKNVEGFFGKSDPFFEISAKVNSAGGLTWQPVYRSKPIMNNLDPNWTPGSVEISRLCNGDLNSPFLVEVWDWEKSGKHTPMGKFETTVNGLLAAQVAGGEGPANSVDTSRAFTLSRTGKDFGKIVVAKATLEGFVQPNTGYVSEPTKDTASSSVPESARPVTFASS